MGKIKIKNLKRGYCINHQEFGYLQYIGLATKNPITNEIKKPYQYVFQTEIDIEGNSKQITLKNGDEIVFLIDKIECNE